MSEACKDEAAACKGSSSSVKSKKCGVRWQHPEIALTIDEDEESCLQKKQGNKTFASLDFEGNCHEKLCRQTFILNEELLNVLLPRLENIIDNHQFRVYVNLLCDWFALFMDHIWLFRNI